MTARHVQTTTARQTSGDGALPAHRAAGVGRAEQPAAPHCMWC